MGHKSTEKYNDICSLKHHMLHYVMGETEKGFEPNPEKVHILKEYVEMIKCLAETEKVCQEADYYESVVQAMEDSAMTERMGYNPNRNRKGQYSDGRAGNRPGDDRSSWGENSSGEMRGYTPEIYSRMMMDAQSDENMPDWNDIEDNQRYGKSFGKFRQAKRHYTRSHSEEDKQKMRDNANQYMMESMATIREIWDSADPDLRKRMKTDLTNLASGMTV